MRGALHGYVVLFRTGGLLTIPVVFVANDVVFVEGAEGNLENLVLLAQTLEAMHCTYRNPELVAGIGAMLRSAECNQD